MDCKVTIIRGQIHVHHIRIKGVKSVAEAKERATKLLKMGSGKLRWTLKNTQFDLKCEKPLPRKVAQ